MEENAETPEEETGDRTLRITGYITEELADKFVVSLHDLAETPGEIAVVLSSEGGSIEEGLRIVDALGIARARGCPVHTVVSGKAYSMAAIIACAGDRRTIYPNSRLMFHGGAVRGGRGRQASHVRRAEGHVRGAVDVRQDFP